MAVREGNWLTGDPEKRDRISQELLQLKQMSKMLRSRSMQSFLERAASQRRDIPLGQPLPPAKPTNAAA
jgi:hypothetical protein